MCLIIDKNDWMSERCCSKHSLESSLFVCKAGREDKEEEGKKEKEKMKEEKKQRMGGGLPTAEMSHCQIDRYKLLVGQSYFYDSCNNWKTSSN